MANDDPNPILGAMKRTEEAKRVEENQMLAAIINTVALRARQLGREYLTPRDAGMIRVIHDGLNDMQPIASGVDAYAPQTHRDPPSTELLDRLNRAIAPVGAEA